VARVVMDSGAMFRLEFAISEFLDTKIGPLIVGDARRYAPKRTGHLAESIGWDVYGLTLYVYATAHYAAWVELGHRVYHPSTGEVGPEMVPEEPYLRPALYKYRTPQVPDPAATFPVAIPHPGVTYSSLAAYERSRPQYGAYVTPEGRLRIPSEVVRAQRAYYRRQARGG
jgi:hypothetical protein